MFFDHIDGLHIRSEASLKVFKHRQKLFSVSLNKKTFFHYLLHKRNVQGIIIQFPFLPCSFMFFTALHTRSHLSLQVSSFGHVSSLLWPELSVPSVTAPSGAGDTGVLGHSRLRCGAGWEGLWIGQWRLAVSGSLIPSEEWNLRQSVYLC